MDSHSGNIPDVQGGRNGDLGSIILFAVAISGLINLGTECGNILGRWRFALNKLCWR